MPSQTLPQHPADGKIEPQLLVDGQRLVTQGFVRDGALVMTNMRVVVELTQQPGDVTFATSTALDKLADVQAAVIQRQAVFLAALDAALAPAQRAGVDVLFPLELQYMLAAEVADLPTLRALAAVPGVEYVWRDNFNKLLTSEGRALTGSTTQAAAGYTGAGIGVAVLDTQFDLLHPELGGSTSLPNPVVKAGQNFGSGTGGSTAIHSQTASTCYHGTGVASIVRRYAPGCHLYALPVFSSVPQPLGPPAYGAFDSDTANAINWCVVNKNGAGGGSPIKIISMSLGGGRYYAPVTSGTLHTACGTALANSIVCFAASGNDGWTDSMASPAASTNCISVGATWDANDAAYAPFPPANCAHNNRLVDERTCYSDTAAFLSIYCPSEEVICASCGGGTAPLGGTSSACPAAAGLTAQFLHAQPLYDGNRAAIVGLYQSTGVAVTGDNTKRRVNLTAAIAGAAGPTGRTVTMVTPPIVGGIFSMTMTYPLTALGNAYFILGGITPFAPMPLWLPGFTMNGFLRVSPDVFVWSGLIVSPFGVAHALPVPNTQSLVGVTFFLQSADCWLGLPFYTCHFSDNYLTVTVSN